MLKMKKICPSYVQKLMPSKDIKILEFDQYH